jgi:hypothetical protein
MALVSKSTQKYLEKFQGIDPKERYEIDDHEGKTQTLTGKELKNYLIAHSRFITVEQQGNYKPKLKK